MTLPKSRTVREEQTSITRAMSCSTIKMAGGATSRCRSPPPDTTAWSTAEKTAVSLASSPDPGSSSSSTRGSVHNARPSSTMRPFPVDSSPAIRSATGQRSNNPITSATRSIRLARFRPSTAPGCDDSQLATRLSWTLSRLKRASRWKVRAIPARPRRWGGQREMFSPRESIRPRVGSKSPVSTLNMVVFPAPLGPIRPTMRPAGTSSETSSRATSPPKRIVTSVARSTGSSHPVSEAMTTPPGWATCRNGHVGAGSHRNLTDPSNATTGQRTQHGHDPTGFAPGLGHGSLWLLGQGYDPEGNGQREVLVHAGRDGQLLHAVDGPGNHRAADERSTAQYHQQKQGQRGRPHEVEGGDGLL